MLNAISHEFVDLIPDDLHEGVLYVCIPYATVMHKCFCGCGHEVVTPLAPRQWSLTFDGEAITLTPSIGNWSFPCRSHYWVREGKVRRARSYTDAEVAELRVGDHELLRDYYEEPPVDEAEVAPPTGHWWTRAARWLRRRFT